MTNYGTSETAGKKKLKKLEIFLSRTKLSEEKICIVARPPVPNKVQGRLEIKSFSYLGILAGPRRSIACLITSKIVKSTLNQYSTYVKRYQEWLQRQGYSKLDTRESVTAQYIQYLTVNEAISYDSLKPVRGALQLYAICLGADISKIWTEPLQNAFSGALKICWNDKKPTYKCPELEYSYVNKLIVDFILPFKDDIFQCDAKKFRASFIMLLEFVMLARAKDLARLRAGDVSVSNDSVQGEIVIFRFRHRKNDAHGTLTSLVLPSMPDKEVNPVEICKLYFERFNLRFAQENDFHDIPLFHRFTCTKLLNSRKYVPSGKEVNTSTILSDMRKQLTEIQYPGAEKIRHNSLRSGGVTQAFENELSESQIRDIGGWHSKSTPLRYRRKNIRDKAKNAKKLLS